MNRDQFEERVESLFENPADSHERARIEAMVAADPALRARWDELQPALESLAGAGLEPLPPGLHVTLVETARAAEPARVPEARGTSHAASWLSFVRAAIEVRPAFALGGAVAAGIAIGAIGLGLLIGPPGGSPDGGLRAARGLAPSTSASLPPVPDAVATTTLEVGGSHVTLTARRGSGAEVIVRVEAREDGPAVVTLAWDPAVLRWSGARWEGSAPTFEPAAGRLRLPLEAPGENEWVFSERSPGQHTIRATLSAAGGEKEEIMRLPR
jgi:hypothetical protein